MADRRAHREGVATRLLVFARSLILLAVVAVGVPALLVFAARERFGGASPLTGVEPPSEWEGGRIRSALTDRLTDETIADIVIRLSLIVAWVAVGVLLLSVIAEVVHMIRHDGLAMPDVRGLGLSQRTARMIASGLLVVVPLFTTPSSAVARESPLVLDPVASAPVAHDAAIADPTGTLAPIVTGRRDGPVAGVDSEAPPAVTAAGSRYVVQAGDSVFGIAERLVGPDSANVAEFAERLVDVNLGRRMPDGRHFTNAAFIDVGWVLELPPSAMAASDLPSAASTDAGDQFGYVSPAGDGDVHIVEAGDSLWSIADEELGDPQRWPEVYEANEGRTFADGRSMRDPDLIQPGWELDVPVDDAGGVDDTDVAPLIDIVEPAHSAPSVPEAPTTEPTVPARLVESLDPGADANADTSSAVARRDNVWDPPAIDIATGADAAPAQAASDLTQAEGRDAQTEESSAAALLGFGSAAMLSAGALTLLAVRRRNHLRRARPRATLPIPAARPAATERALRTIGAGERFTRVETGVRAAARALADQGERVLACSVSADGSLELVTTGSVELSGPWEGSADTWHLAASTPLELLAAEADGVDVTCPTLVQLGTDDHGRDVYVDLEATEAIEVGGPGAQADAVVAAIAATLAGSVLAEVTTLVGLGVPDAAFLGHRLYSPVTDPQRAFEAAADAIGSTAGMTTSTFELRIRGSAGDTWEPTVVLVGAAAGTINPPSTRNGLAVVSASPIHGPSSRLAPDGDAWALMPAGLRLTPVGLSPDDVAAIAELVTVVEPEIVVDPPADGRLLDRSALTDDHTFVVGADPATADATATVTGTGDGAAVSPVTGEPSTGGSSGIDVGSNPAPPRDPGSSPDVDAAVETEPALPHALLVRLIGPVDVVDAQGDAVSFERSKTRELVAWLATHRDRSTRSAARTALWELDVRDATFANVVSEARRSLARLVDPPDGDEWVGRTMTDSLPLHPLVITDADLVRHALAAARMQPPAQAIATLGPAVEFISGMPFSGTSYLWPDSEGITSNLVLLATSATTELAAHCLSTGDIDGVFSATGRGLQVLPGHEELIGLRMEAHARAGDHAGVRQEWEAYERVINADPWSDGEPAPKLVELRRRLLDPAR